MLKKKWLFAILFSAMLAVIVLVGSLRTEKVTTPSSKKGLPKLIMLTTSDYPPFQYRDTATSDELIGFDVDLAKYITRQLGYEVEVMDTAFTGIIAALQTGRADFSVAGMVPTPKRRKNVDFSDIYYEVKNAILARKGRDLKTPADLFVKKVAVLLGSVSERTARKFKDIIIELRDQPNEIIEELKANRIDAAIIEDTVALGYVARNPELEFYVIPNTEVLGYAIAFPKGSSLVNSFNKVLRQKKENGELERLRKKWFENYQKETVRNASSSRFSFAKIATSVPFIVRGVSVTLQFTTLSALFGFAWGTLLALFKISTIKPLVWMGTAYTSVFRGTPMLLQIAIVYYAIPQLTGYNISALLAGVATFTLNSGAYISETIRAGILSVDKGQREVALSLGVPYKLMMQDIILPQAIKNILPALVNESISLLKGSAFISTISVTDLLRRAQIVGAEKYTYFEPLIFAGVLYYLMIMILTWSGYALERRLQRSS